MREEAISAEEVRRIAALARLALTEGEIEQMTVELGAILEYVSRLATLDLPSESAASDFNASGLRLDEPLEPLGSRTALAGAPRAERSHFVVPRVIDR